jgi:hypothetical protein
LGPVEAGEGQKMTRVEKIGLVKLLKIAITMLGGIMKKNHRMEIVIENPLIVFLYPCDEFFMTFLII